MDAKGKPKEGGKSVQVARLQPKCFEKGSVIIDPKAKADRRDPAAVGSWSENGFVLAEGTLSGWLQGYPRGTGSFRGGPSVSASTHIARLFIHERYKHIDLCFRHKTELAVVFDKLVSLVGGTLWSRPQHAFGFSSSNRGLAFNSPSLFLAR